MADGRLECSASAVVASTAKQHQGRKKERNLMPNNQPNQGKRRTKPLLADTIGRSLSTSLLGHSASNAISDGNEEYSSRSLAVPFSMSMHSISGSAYSYASSSNTLTPSSYETSSDTASRYTSDESSDSIRHVYNPYTSYAETNRVVSLDGKACRRDVDILAAKYGSVSHMGLLDPSYSVFVSDDRTGGICFKTLYKVAVVMGDPLCETGDIPRLLSEFKQYRRRKRWNMSILGAGEGFVRYYNDVKKRSTILQFAKERTLNPLTNEVLHETSGKRIITQCRQLLDPNKGGITIEVYIPLLQDPEPKLETDLAAIYDEWRIARNQSGKPQAFITEYDPFLMPHLMTYIYTRGPDGEMKGFAGLRRIGPKAGYHIDPCIAAPGTRKGISDLLLFASMAYLRQLGVSYLSLGYEPSESLVPISEMSPSIAHLTRGIYRHTFRRLPISGKRAYFDKFKPDDDQDSPVYLIFHSRLPEPRQVVSVAHVANISIRRLLFGETQSKDS
ncbi:hypothetical protein BJX64DRAFT_253996 [Aspergillus heterothallicus]